ncbi:hypothetical protein TNCV_654691 [Trichonephila clavipes]|nr:hypothetical protein TNCV_654691 [Trichonephila clavipes]
MRLSPSRYSAFPPVYDTDLKTKGTATTVSMIQGPQAKGVPTRVSKPIIAPDKRFRYLLHPAGTLLALWLTD